MDALGTVLIVARGGPQWSATADVLSDEYDYRVLTARSAEDAASALSDAHVDIVLAEHDSNGPATSIESCSASVRLTSGGAFAIVESRSPNAAHAV